jgi:hypothetical protein
MNWDQIELFRGIDLNDYFVLDWQYAADRLVFELEASIWPKSKYYKKPKLSEYTCYQKATLQIIGPKRVTGLLSKNSIRPNYDLDGTIDYGNIDSLSMLEGNFELSGHFGDVKITGGELRFEVHT